MNRDSSSPARMKDRFREATARAILDAAEMTLAEEGLQAARMEAIAAHAGVAVGTVYNYFADRASLLAALLAARREGLVAALDGALASAEAEAFAAQLETFLRAFLAHVEAHRAFFAMLVEGDPGKAHGHAAEALDAVYGRFEVLVGRGVASGALRPAHAELYPALLIGMCRGLTLREFRVRRGAGLASRAPALTQVFLDGAGATK